MNKYRNDNVNNFMARLEDDLTAIVAREFSNLEVAEVLKRNRKDHPEMSLEQATILAMRDKAAVTMRKTHTIATCMDRMTIMVEQMANEMEDQQKADLYRKRLGVVTDFDSVLKRLL